MPFNPRAAYNTVIDVDGDIFLYQGGAFYDRQGNSWTTIPPSNNGYNAVSWSLVNVQPITLNSASPATLTNPTLQATNTVDNYTQISIQNKSATANASADLICYPDNVTASDLTGFCDIGITSSAFAQSAYSVTAANEGYLFASAPTGASKSGALVLATDSTGTDNSIRFYVGGFNKAVGAFSAKITGSNGLFTAAEGYAEGGKVISANGATVTYTVAAKKSYAYVTSTAASLAVTFPAGAAAIDGMRITFVTDTSIATVTWASTGTTFVGAPAATTANVPNRFVYDHATLKWYIA